MSVLELDVQLYVGLNKNGTLTLFAEIGDADHTVEESADLECLLARQPGYYVCGDPRGYRTKKERREVEVCINNFERATKRAVKEARKELDRYKTWREMRQVQ